MPTERLPFGNAFIIDTPALDELGKKIYAQEKQKENYRLQQSKQLDDEFARNLSGIRDADIGDLTKAYGDFKIAHQNLMRKKQGGTPQEQLEVLRKKADIYDVLNKSKEEKTWEDAQSKQIMTDKKGFYADDAHQQLIDRRKTPINKLDRSKDENLLYKYSMPDLNKELNTARGGSALKEVRVKLGQSKSDPLKDDVEVYKVGNSPTQFYNNLLQGIVANNKGRNFTGIINNKYSEQELEDLKDRYYAKINDPKFKAVYGEPQQLPESANNTDLGKAVAIQTMEEVVNNPLQSKVISETNIDRQTKNRQEFQKAQQERAHKNSLARLYVYAGIQDRKPETIGRNIDNLIGQHIEDARGNNGEVITDNATFESITGKKKSGNSVLMFDEANNKYTYGTKDATTGEIKPAGEVPVDLARVKLTKTYKSGLDSKYNTGKKIEPSKEKYPLPKGKPKDIEQNGYKYTYNPNTGKYE